MVVVVRGGGGGGGDMVILVKTKCGIVMLEHFPYRTGEHSDGPQDSLDKKDDVKAGSSSKDGSDETTPLLGGGGSEPEGNNIQQSVEVKLRDFQLIRVPQSAVS